MTKYRTFYRTLLLSALVACTGFRDAAAATPPAYSVSDLGTLGGTTSYGIGINASGQVSGYAYTTGDATFHAFLFDGTMHDLGTLGGSFSNGYGINDSGQVSGYSKTTGDATLHAFLYDGTLHDLGSLDGDYNVGFGINDSGQVTGESGGHVFLWAPTTPNGDSGTINDLGPGAGHDINDSGQVTGFAGDHVFLWTPTAPNGGTGSMQDLGTLGGNYSTGYGINASGQVSGYSYTSGDAELHAFLYDGTLHDLGTLGGTESQGFGINASGQVTGGSYPTGEAVFHAFLYSSGSGMVDLNALIDPLSGWELQFGTGINDAGQITGAGLIGGEQHAFLLTPVPEPSAIALLALGLPLLVGRKLRQFCIGGASGVRRFALAAATRADAGLARPTEFKTKSGQGLRVNQRETKKSILYFACRVTRAIQAI